MFLLQLFANSKSNSTTQSQTQSMGGSHEESSSSTVGGSQTHTEGGSNTQTVGGSKTHSETSSESHSKGGSESASLGHTYASGEISDKTQQKYDQYSDDYTQNQKVDDAYKRLQDTIDNKPGFQSSYENKLDELYSQIMNRDKFSYDFNADAMYNLYKDQYTTQGKQAMQDASGQAAALTGGYNSSYGQSVAQQTYQDYLQRLNDMIPTLRNQAYQEYVQEGQDLLNKYGITNDAYNREYGQYRDAVSDWQTDRAFNQSNYQDERNWDYNQFANERNFWNQEYWNEKNSAHTTDNQASARDWNDTYAHSVTDSTTDYWENQAKQYWEDSMTNYWSNTNSSSNAMNWNNSMTNSMTNSMSMSGASARGSSSNDLLRNMGGNNNSYTSPATAWQDRANTQAEYLARNVNGTDENSSYYGSDNYNGAGSWNNLADDSPLKANNKLLSEIVDKAEKQKDLDSYFDSLLDKGYKYSANGKKYELDEDDIAYLYRLLGMN